MDEVAGHGACVDAYWEINMHLTRNQPTVALESYLTQQLTREHRHHRPHGNSVGIVRGDETIGILLALPRPYYLAIPAACILFLVYLFAFRDSSPADFHLPPSPSAGVPGHALSDTPPTHSAGNATLGVSILID